MFSVSARPQTQGFTKKIWCFNFNKSFHFSVFLWVQTEKQPELKSYSLSFHSLICPFPALKHSYFQVHENFIGLFRFLEEKDEVHSLAEIGKCRCIMDCTRKKVWLALQLLTLQSERDQLTNGSWKTTELTGAVNNNPGLPHLLVPERKELGLGRTPCQLVTKMRSEPIYTNISNSDSKIKKKKPLKT